MTEPEWTIRTLTRADGPRYRELRLRALRESPRAFASSWEEERSRPPEHFAERCAPSELGRIQAAASPSGELLGMAGLYREGRPKLRHKGWIWGVFVLPAARGQGCGRALLDSLLSWARAQPDLRQVQLGVAADNAPARALYASCGFETYGVEPGALVVAGEAIDEELMVLRL